MLKKLAINGGKPILKKALSFNPVYLDKKENGAVMKVMQSKRLSDFIGANNEYFLGGKEVKRLEASFRKKFKVSYAVSFNSATTALHGAIIALKIGPGDEVIVPPYTMSASVSCVLMNGAIPIFADINDKTFCIDPTSIRQRINKRTKAIMVVNLFGRPANFDKILKIVKKYNLKIIEDNAQAPGAKYKNKFCGTIGDIGVFSLNVHKVIQCGEGGVLVTNNKNYALRAQLARNHGEVVADQMPKLKDKVILGSNYRMTELQAAIAQEQLKKLDRLNQNRISLAKYLTKKLGGIPGVECPETENNIKHVYHVYPIKIRENILGISRDKFVKAMTAEGFPMSNGYVKPIYLLPIFQEKKVFNNTHFPFVSKYYSGKPDYQKGICPVCERMYKKELTFTAVCQHPYGKREVDLFVKAIKKVITYKSELL